MPTQDNSDTDTFTSMASQRGALVPELSVPQLPGPRTNILEWWVRGIKDSLVPPLTDPMDVAFGDMLEVETPSGQWIRARCMGHQWDADGTVWILATPYLMAHLNPVQRTKYPLERVRKGVKRAVSHQRSR